LRVIRSRWLVVFDKQIEPINTVAQLLPRGEHAVNILLAKGPGSLARLAALIIAWQQNHDVLASPWYLLF
jgi:hypothetical protein